MRAVMGISVCLVAAACGAVIGTPPPEERVVPAVPPGAPAAPRSLWCENVVEMQTARRSGVTSIWLSNGVRVHHLRIGTRPGQVVATIALLGGKLLEDASSHGMTEITASVLGDWETVAPSATAAARLTRQDVSIKATAWMDALTLQISGSAADAGAAISIARELLVGPTVARESVDAARQELVRGLRMSGADARTVILRETDRALDGGADARMFPVQERDLGAISAERVSEWVRQQARENGSAIEVAIVGDLALADALAMVDTTLGTLPRRERVSPRTNIARRVLVGGPPAAVQKDIVGITPVGTGRVMVVRGCFGPEMGELAEQRALRALIRITTARIKVRLAEPQFGMSASAVDISSALTPTPMVGLGTVLVMATVDASKGAAVGAAIDAELAALAAVPPTVDELLPIADELGKQVTQLEEKPVYWSGVLARCNSQGIEPDEIASGAAYYKALTPEKVSEVFRKFWRDERRIAITVRGPERVELRDKK